MTRAEEVIANKLGRDDSLVVIAPATRYFHISELYGFAERKAGLDAVVEPIIAGMGPGYMRSVYAAAIASHEEKNARILAAGGRLTEDDVAHIVEWEKKLQSVN